MDLSTLKPSEQMVEILHPVTQMPVGIRVTLVHVQDESLRKLLRQFTDERLRLEARGKNLKSDDIESNMHNLNFSAMRSWEWYNPTGVKGDKGFDETKQAEWKGNKSPEFNKKNVFEVFDTLPWFRDVITKEISEYEGFLPS